MTKIMFKADQTHCFEAKKLSIIFLPDRAPHEFKGQYAMNTGKGIGYYINIKPMG